MSVEFIDRSKVSYLVLNEERRARAWKAVLGTETAEQRKRELREAQERSQAFVMTEVNHG